MGCNGLWHTCCTNFLLLLVHNRLIDFIFSRSIIPSYRILLFRCSCWIHRRSGGFEQFPSLWYDNCNAIIHSGACLDSWILFPWSWTRRTDVCHVAYRSGCSEQCSNCWRCHAGFEDWAYGWRNTLASANCRNCWCHNWCIRDRTNDCTPPQGIPNFIDCLYRNE